MRSTLSPNPSESRSEEVNDVLTNMPQWMTQWGIITVLGLVALFLLAGWFIKFPDTVAGEVTLTTPVPPVSLIAKANGRVHFLVKERQAVKKGDYLAVIENVADTPDMLYLAARLEEAGRLLQTPDFPYTRLTWREDLQVGEVQRAYLDYLESVAAYASLAGSDRHGKQAAEVKAELRYVRQIIGHLQAGEAPAAEKTVTDPVFGGQEVVGESSPSAYDNMIAGRIARENAVNVIRHKMRISQLEGKLAELEAEARAKDEQYRHRVRETFKILDGQVRLWRDHYVQQAPLDGQVAFHKFWSDLQFVKAGEEIMSIVPGNQPVFGKMNIPVQGAGKVAVGQAVMIRLHNYPYHEYGALPGRVQSVSAVPREDKYVVDIRISQGLTTNTGRQIAFRQEMPGRAAIVVKDLRVFERIFKDLIPQ